MSSIQIVVAAGTTVAGFPQAVLDGTVSFYSVRANGSTRKVSFPADGTQEREVAEWVAEQRDEGRTMKAIADEMHISIPSLRRIINALLLAEEVEEYTEEDIAELLDGLDAEPAEATSEAVAVALYEATAPVFGPLQANGSF